MNSKQELGAVTMAVDGHVAIITVENEAKMNAFTPEMMKQLSDHLTTVDEDDGLWAAVLSFSGKHTTAGLDMPRFFGPDAEPQAVPDGQVDPFGLSRQCRKPVVAAVQGITYTIGIEMMLAADIAVAADTTRFAQLESKRGIAPLGGAHFRYLTRTGWGNAMYHLFLCDEYDAERALQLGFVQEVVPEGDQIERAIELAHEICKNAPLGIRATKEGARKFLEAAEQAAIAEIDRIQETVFGTEDFREGIQSFVERRDAEFQGK
ncbi:crotonase/enoyl-CoA hydratase family protein [Brevibacterium sp. UCMA 11754]|uniref:crotonase/enoyl-CoA hydratase family protein n=1 Tax=Brevibacterium sp. UCMA 11754 TaxID=2749198 RepID=UPI001F34205B|nr:crotonase/enoyl-CoA hydratase family protein [Brevibacterium sp. UCMA 11754]MCF2571116.1 crotonase/enoyl-CoA hydratase family protein [Brevibacterium sp. UCMA 11754]